MRQLELADVSWAIETLPEDAPVRGNAIASGDDAADREIEDRIIADLESGNDWAWCTVCVRGEFHGLTSETHLGCCSYEDPDAFKAGGYYEDMQREVISELQEQIEDLAKSGIFE